MNPLEKAVALMEAATDGDLERLCGAERLMLGRQLRRWEDALTRTSPEKPKAGVLAQLDREGSR